MTLDLVSKNMSVALDDIPGSLFEMLREFKIDAPEYSKIEVYYYGTTRLSSRAQVESLLGETKELLRCYLDRATLKIQREKKITAKDPTVRDRILEPMLADDMWLAKLNRIIEVCEDGLSTDGTLVCAGD